jgi:hypothetical protein
MRSRDFSDPRITLLSDGKIMVVQDAGVARLTSAGDVDASYGRVLADLPGHGVLEADAETGEAWFTANGVATTLALHKLAAGGSSVSPIRLESGVLICTGSDGVDEMSASLGEELTDDLTVARRRDDVARVFNRADVTLMSFGRHGRQRHHHHRTRPATFPRPSPGATVDDKILGGDGSDSLSGNAGPTPSTVATAPTASAATAHATS